MTIEAPRNPNYCATIVTLKDFVDLPNCDNVKAALIFGNSVIVSKDCAVGDQGFFFPVETALSGEFMRENNLYRKPEWGNADSAKSGFFERHGRVRAVRFRGHKSEGFWIPIGSIFYAGRHVLDFFRDIGEEVEGCAFDRIGPHEICSKYVPAGQVAAGAAATARGRRPNLSDGIVDGQFRFHFDTENLRRNIHKICSDDFISITDKWHGTSVVIGKLLVKRSLSWMERIAVRLGVSVSRSAYGLVYSSRKVLKAVNGVQKHVDHFYTSDIWGAVAREVEHLIPSGYTLYGEIVGFTADGAAIQKGYSYLCEPRQHRFLVYRVTSTNAEGVTVELSATQLEEFCLSRGLETCPLLYCGFAEDLVPFTQPDMNAWQAALLRHVEQNYVQDKDCPYNPGRPAEGVVLRLDRLTQCESFKLKNFRFLEWESKSLDQGELDTESSQEASPFAAGQ